jgi:biotin-[acetyl-CoA-carboxylase] ligase BirA-like protein
VRRLICLAEADSTNRYLQSSPCLKPFTSVRALMQTAGRGRSERSWFSGRPGENLAFSVLLPYRTAAFGLLPAHVAIIVHEVLSRFVKTRIKWPNDIIAEGRKLAGILCESYSTQQNLFIAGIGINVQERNFPAELKKSATSLALLTGKIHDAGLLWLQLTRALVREFRRPRSAQEIIRAYNASAMRYHRRREYPAEVLEFETLLSDGRAVFRCGSERVTLEQAG